MSETDPSDSDNQFRDLFDRKRRGERIAQRLPSWVVPVSQDPRDVQRAMDYDVASFVDTRLGENIDPDAVHDRDVYKGYLDKVLDEGEQLGAPHQFGAWPHWIVENGEPVGTMGFLIRERDLEYTSVYIRPRFRRQRRAGRLFQIIKNEALEVGIDRLLVSCHWGNDNALRFYLAQGMWVFRWKHEIHFATWRDRPPLQMQIDGSRAHFLVHDRVVGVAENRGDRLAWQLTDDRDKSVLGQLEGTAALYLALHGWPIIRSDELWHKQVFHGSSDGGTFESLAHRIRRFERVLRAHGWRTPPPNPSFATLPTLAGVKLAPDALDVAVSDGRSYGYPYELLDPRAASADPVVDAQIQLDEVICTRRSGERAAVSIDEILDVNESREELERTLAYWRDYRASR